MSKANDGKSDLKASYTPVAPLNKDELDKEIRKCFTEMGEFDPEFQLFDIEETIGNLKALLNNQILRELEDIVDVKPTHDYNDTIVENIFRRLRELNTLKDKVE